MQFNKFTLWIVNYYGKINNILEANNMSYYLPTLTEFNQINSGINPRPTSVLQQCINAEIVKTIFQLYISCICIPIITTANQLHI